MRLGSKILVSVCAVFATGAVGLLGYGLVIKAQAESLKEDVKALSVVSSTESDVDALARNHPRFLDSQTSSEGATITTFRVRNRWLAFLRLEPPTEFGASVFVRNRRVYHLSAWLMRTMPIYPTFGASAGAVDEFSEYSQSNSASPHWGHYEFPTPIGKPYLRVVLDSHATPTERRHAFEFRFACFVKPGGGCDLPCDYLPAAWKDFRRQVGSPELFDRYYPKNARCD